MTTVTRNCEYCNAEFKAVRPHQRFDTTKCRVYASRYGASYGNPASITRAGPEPADESVGAALEAARRFTPVTIADHKTVAAIRVHRPTADPNLWKITVPPNSGIAAGKIHAALVAHAGDLVSLANRLGSQIGEPLYTLRTQPTRKRRIS